LSSGTLAELATTCSALLLLCSRQIIAKCEYVASVNKSSDLLTVKSTDSYMLEGERNILSTTWLKVACL
jgi:hypothetical protein